MKQNHTICKIITLFFFGCTLALSQPHRVYVAALDESSFTLAWGKADGKLRNTIGYGATEVGNATLKVGTSTYNTALGWFRIAGLNPDTSYPYEVSLEGIRIGSGIIRTWPAQSRSLAFFVIGDWGNGSIAQYAIAARMEKERQKLDQAGVPVRFILSTGDNIYSGGDEDRDWERKFFVPYAETLRAIPFYAVLGNHDGNESEKPGDLPTYLDNFFAPSGPMARWYNFRYGGFAEFFALDSTTNQYPGTEASAFLATEEQSKWLDQNLSKPGPLWRIAFMHHPMFTAGPNHAPSLPKLSHWLQSFRSHGVSAVFAGHEHNFQFSERNSSTGNMQFIVSGAGGELRSSSVLSKMAARNIAAWSPQPHFLIVQIEGDSMTVQPIGVKAIQVRDSKAKPVKLPLIVPRQNP